MHVSTTTKTLASLNSMFSAQGRSEAMATLSNLATSNGIALNQQRGQTQKRVAFVLDYSGSMSGSKIRSALENLTSIVDNHIHEQDSVAIVHFTSDVVVDLSLIKKKGNVDAIRSTIASLNRPSGSTAMYDAVLRAATILSENATNSDWIIALTDGEDNSSSLTPLQLIDKLKNSYRQANVIIIGVGSDVQHETLSSIAAATPKGTFVFASGDKQSIDDAFGAALSVIEAGQIIIED